MLAPKQLIPSKTCLSCEFCCRFPKPNTVWQPRLTAGEISAFDKLGFKNKILKGAVKSKAQGKFFACSFLRSSKNACGIYRQRPLECRLYPFVLMVGKDGVLLAAHLACPFVLENIKTAEFKRHAAYLKKYFSRESSRKFIKANPAIAQNYHGYAKELVSLFTIH